MDNTKIVTNKADQVRIVIHGESPKRQPAAPNWKPPKPPGVRRGGEHRRIRRVRSKGHAAGYDAGPPEYQIYDREELRWEDIDLLRKRGEASAAEYWLSHYLLGSSWAAHKASVRDLLIGLYYFENEIRFKRRFGADRLWERFWEFFGYDTFLLEAYMVLDASVRAERRYRAIQKLAEKFFRWPLHPARLRIAQPYLKRRADEEGVSSKQALRTAVKANMVHALDVPPDTPLVELYEVAHARMANALMEDLVGPAWRRDTGSADAIDDAEEPSGSDDVEQQAQERADIRQAKKLIQDLPRAQKTAMLKRIAGATLMGAERRALHEARRKMKEAIGAM